PSTGLDRLVCITERFLQSGRLADLLWSFCLQPAPSGSPQLRETLLARLTSLPDITANKLHPNNRALFVPQRYYPLLASEMLAALERTCQALRGYSDGMFVEVCSCMCRFTFTQLFCPVLAVMAPRLAVCTRSDMVWQRVCWKLLENVPERWMESVLTGLVQAVKSADFAEETREPSTHRSTSQSRPASQRSKSDPDSDLDRSVVTLLAILFRISSPQVREAQGETRGYPTQHRSSPLQQNHPAPRRKDAVDAHLICISSVFIANGFSDCFDISNILVKSPCSCSNLSPDTHLKADSFYLVSVHRCGRRRPRCGLPQFSRAEPGAAG
ncbi:hypothetical protein XENOCAPTIV_002136, partial [Xenoophorus captivus]